MEFISHLGQTDSKGTMQLISDNSASGKIKLSDPMREAGEGGLLRVIVDWSSRGTPLNRDQVVSKANLSKNYIPSKGKSKKSLRDKNKLTPFRKQR